MGAAAPQKVLVVGDVMADIICRPEGPLVVGSDRRASIWRRGGGSGANQAVWLASFGLEVRFAARVSADDRDALSAAFLRDGLEPHLAGDPERPSGTIVTIVDPNGERSFLTDRGANAALCADDLPPTLLTGCKQLVVSGYSLFEPEPRAGAMALMAAARMQGVRVAVDPASVGFLEEVGPSRFLEWTAGADIVFANESEAETLTGRAATEDQIRALGTTYGRVIIKRGAVGAVLGGAAGVALDLPAPAVPVLDTTGAGDAFAAAFIAAELAGAVDEVALRRAIAAGSEAVQQIGGRPARRD